MRSSDQISRSFAPIYSRIPLTDQQRRWLHLSGRAILVAGLTLSMILFWGEVAGSLLNRDAGAIGTHLFVAADALLVLTLLFHFALMFQTLNLAVNSVVPGLTHDAWEASVQNGKGTRAFVQRKWWAIVQHQWRRYLLLGLLRAGCLAWIYGNFNRFSLYIASSFPVLPSVSTTLLAGGAVLLMTMLNLVFTAACGMWASGQTGHSLSSLLRAVFNRIVLLVGTFLILGLAMNGLNLFTQTDPTSRSNLVSPLQNIVSPAAYTMLDNGVTVTGQFWKWQIPLTDTLMAVLFALVLYGLLTILALWIAQRRSVRQAFVAHRSMPQAQD